MKNVWKFALIGAIFIGIQGCDSDSAGFWDRRDNDIVNGSDSDNDTNGEGTTNLNPDPDCIADLEEQEADYVPKQLLVGFIEGTSSLKAYTLFDKYGVHVIKGNPGSYFLIEVPEKHEIEYACALAEEEIIRYSELNYIVVIEQGHSGMSVGTGHIEPAPIPAGPSLAF